MKLIERVEDKRVHTNRGRPPRLAGNPYVAKVSHDPFLASQVFSAAPATNATNNANRRTKDLNIMSRLFVVL